MESKILPEKIRMMRTLKGFSQEYMAEKLSITQKAYSKYENGDVKLTFERVKDIAAILEVDILELLQSSENIYNNHNNNQVGGTAYNVVYNGSEMIEKLESQFKITIEKMESEIAFLRSILKDHLQKK